MADYKVLSTVGINLLIIELFIYLSVLLQSQSRLPLVEILERSNAGFYESDG